jgi:hypothetical protein
MLLELGLPLTPGSEVTHFGGSIGGEDFEFEVTPDGEIVKSGKKP